MTGSNSSLSSAGFDRFNVEFAATVGPCGRAAVPFLVERRARKAVAKINELYTLPDPLHRRLEAEEQEEQMPLEEPGC